MALSEQATIGTTGTQQYTGGILRLVLIAVALAIVWLGVLPWVAERPRVHSRVEWLAEQRIDPTAMYYTELEMMEPILKRLEKRERESQGVRVP